MTLRAKNFKGWPVHQSKYGAITCKCNQGHIHDSRGEAGYCNQLAILKKAGEIIDYEIQKTFDLVVNGKTVARHRVDFLVQGKDKTVVHEYKGFKTEVWRLKYNLFQACYPDIEYRIVTEGDLLRARYPN